MTDFTTTTGISDEDVDSALAFIPSAGIALTASDARLAEVLSLFQSFGQSDGGHHKAWVIDQAARIITGERYEDFVDDYQFGATELSREDAEAEGDFYDWDAGIAP